MITLHFNHAHLEITAKMLLAIANTFKAERHGAFVELIHTIADNAVRGVYANVPAYPVWEYKHYNSINIDVFVVGHEPLRLQLNENGVTERLTDDWVKLSVEDVKGLCRFFYRHGQYEQLSKLIEMPTPDDDEPF